MKKFLIALIFLLSSFSLQMLAQQHLFQKINEMIDSVSIENLTEHIRILEDAGGHQSRVTFTAGNDSALNYIYNYFKDHTNVSSLVLDTFYIPIADPPYNTQPQVNVIATIEGTLNPSRYFVLGAHYDASASRMGSSIWNSQWRTIKAPGADDNATGVAAIMEIARVMTDTAFNFEGDYSLVFVAFAAEEANPSFGSGHYGSKHYAKTSKDSSKNIMGAVSIDMIGYNNNHLYQAIVSNSASQWIGERFIDANELFEIDLLMNAPPFPNATYSDHDSFWNEGYHAVLMIENAPPWNSNQFYTANPYYHTSYDTIGTVNMELVKKVTELNLALSAAVTGRLTTSTDETDTAIPAEYVLMQNYPNPFNPSTVIRYSIPGEGKVQLKVYDMLGKEISQLVNKVQSAGNYEVRFDADGLSTGVYFYQLITGDFVETRKMMLVQ